MSAPAPVVPEFGPDRVRPVVNALRWAETHPEHSRQVLRTAATYLTREDLLAVLALLITDLSEARRARA